MFEEQIAQGNSMISRLEPEIGLSYAQRDQRPQHERVATKEYDAWCKSVDERIRTNFGKDTIARYDLIWELFRDEAALISQRKSDEASCALNAVRRVVALLVELEKRSEMKESQPRQYPAHKPFRSKAQNGEPAGAPPEKKGGQMIFISYSHVDEKWRKKLEMVLSPLTRAQALDLWSDTKIDPGTKWKQEIQEALERADAAILLVTQAFLASDFIVTNELPRILERAKDRRIPILWIPISNSMYAHTEIANYQAVIDPKRPLDTFKGAQLNTKLVEIGTAISGALEKAQKAEA